jgi:hypothetical protein
VPDAVGVGNRNRAAEHTAFLDPGGPGEIAEAIAGEPAGKDRLPLLALGPDDGDSGAGGVLAGSLDDRGLADFNAGDVRDGVQGTRSPLERDAEVAGARLGRLRERPGRETDANDHDEERATRGSHASFLGCGSIITVEPSWYHMAKP